MSERTILKKLSRHGQRVSSYLPKTEERPVIVVSGMVLLFASFSSRNLEWSVSIWFGVALSVGRSFICILVRNPSAAGVLCSSYQSWIVFWGGCKCLVPVEPFPNACGTWTGDGSVGGSLHTLLSMLSTFFLWQIGGLLALPVFLGRRVGGDAVFGCCTESKVQIFFYGCRPGMTMRAMC